MTDKTAEPKSVIYSHHDLLGSPIHIGIKVAVAGSNMLTICTVTNLTPKMVRVVSVNSTRRDTGRLVYGAQCVIVDNADVLAYILKGR